MISALGGEKLKATFALAQRKVAPCAVKKDLELCHLTGPACGQGWRLEPYLFMALRTFQALRFLS